MMFLKSLKSCRYCFRQGNLFAHTLHGIARHREEIRLLSGWRSVLQLPRTSSPSEPSLVRRSSLCESDEPPLNALPSSKTNVRARDRSSVRSNSEIVHRAFPTNIVRHFPTRKMMSIELFSWTIKSLGVRDAHSRDFSQSFLYTV